MITTLGILQFAPETGEMELIATHPEVTVEQVLANTGWPLRVAPKLTQTPVPTESELAMLCRTSKLTEIGLLQFDRSLAALHDVQGACERIKKTPFPVNVSAMTRVIAWAMGAILAIAVMNADNSFDIVDMVVIPALMLSLRGTHYGSLLRIILAGQPCLILCT